MLSHHASVKIQILKVKGKEHLQYLYAESQLYGDHFQRKKIVFMQKLKYGRYEAINLLHLCEL